MATYMVWVNERFMVKVDANTSGGAEHIILDDYDGIQFAQAFEVGKDTRSEYFENVMTDAKLISLDELRGLSDEYIINCDILGKAIRKSNDIDMQIVAVKEELKSLESLRDDYSKNVIIARNLVNGAKRAINLITEEDR